MRVRLDTKQAGGATLGDHLGSVWRQTGERPQELEFPDVPPDGQYLWAWFWELGEASYAEIEAWSQLTGEIIRPWEVRALRRMAAAMGHARAEQKNT